MKGLLGFALLGIMSAPMVLAQSDLLGVNDSTSVRRIEFSYTDADRYPPRVSVSELRQLTATRAIPRRYRLQRLLGRTKQEDYILNPIELQRDVVRLRQAFQEAGYPHTYVGYAPSTLDRASNTAVIRFEITQGPPVIIQDVGFYAGSRFLALSLDAELREAWIDFRDRTSFEVGDVFTHFELVQIEDKVLSWFKDKGYAFATLTSSVHIYSGINAADISFQVDTGPRGFVDRIEVEGAPAVHRRVILRSLPFEPGDVFSQRDLIEGQRALFALGLFSVVQVETPPQVQDSTVEVRINLESARPRHISAETGYHQRQGITGEGRWTHRNFLDGARTLTLTAQIQTGLLASAGIGALAGRSARGAVVFTQPHLGFNQLRGILEPFIQYERDPLAGASSEIFGFNRREVGVSTTFIYGLEQTRVLSLRYSLSRTKNFTTSTSTDAYDKSVLRLGGTLGWTDNLLRPTRGVIFQPLIEQGGRIESWLGARPFGVNYLKMQLQVAAYWPLSRNVNFSGRFKAGRVWAGGTRSRTLYTSEGTQVIDTQFLQPTEDRFDPLRFYVGGADDVRGWSTGLAGPKAIRTQDRDGEASLEDGVYEPIGGLARLVASAEVRFRLSGPWYGAAFADAGAVSSERAENCVGPFFEDPNRTRDISIQCGFRDTGRITLRQFKVGAGLGLRYDTPIGFVRLDVAAKLNPDPLDLQSSEDALAATGGSQDDSRNTWYRFNVHFSIGQAF
ncbi:MAG: BamA/TamA family outer membrane protein [Bacteroidota bacterium]|nr:BamA/TamA family outer membrane protein [Bacteroidota bacterium]MXW14826.1 BamA/TamA family outer membrane protein [Rhodothermaceae bacterium]MXW33490.1 BamA/TamA family outer membrane protein [Rhodothermaceae bacterium]MYC05514.1 BamA/TamA family outer membrane protein [Rhodothermaceae bacterium]MYE63057.1 BamA/TamA family outer membrane protein [Rhodothermaceae bacterium]